MKEIAMYRKLAHKNNNTVSFQRYFDVLLKYAQLNNVDAQFDLALLYESEEFMALIGQDVNNDEAFQWHKRACKLGCGEACCNLANMYFDKEGMEQKRIQFLRKGMRLGRPEAAYSLGKYYLKIANLRQATIYFNKSILLDKYWGESYFEIGKINYSRRKYKNAYKLFKQAIETKNITEDTIERIRFYIGRMYFYGQYVEKSISKAKYLFEKANIDNNHEDIAKFCRENAVLLKMTKKEKVVIN